MIKVLAATGYKSNELGIFNLKEKAIFYIKGIIKKRILQYIEEGLEWVIISGQLGVELWAGEVVIELKEDYPHVGLAVLTPFLDQEKRWKEPFQEQYMNVINEADYVESITNRPYETPAQFRLKTSFIIDKSDALLTFYDESQPGSPEYYITEAKKKLDSGQKYDIITINLDEINEFINDFHQDF